MKEKDTVVFATKEHEPPAARITRRASKFLVNLLSLKQYAVQPGLSFNVQPKSAKHFYLKYDDWRGAVVVKVDKIMLPDPDTRDENAQWKETMSFRRVFDSEEAAAKSKGQKDHGDALGGRAMVRIYRQEKRLEENDPSNSYTTYHVGDCRYMGDIRTLIGVVRWKSEHANDLAEDYFNEYREAEEVTTGPDVAQNPAL